MYAHCLSVSAASIVISDQWPGRACMMSNVHTKSILSMKLEAIFYVWPSFYMHVFRYIYGKAIMFE
jgi:hypothetical protein